MNAICETLNAFVASCEPLIREGRFEALTAELRAHREHILACILCRQQWAFYQAVGLGMRQPRDYASARALLSALITSEQVDEGLRARARNFAGMLARFQDRYSQALGLYQRAFEACREAGDLNGQARALLNQAVILNNHLQRFKPTLALLDQAASLLEQAGNQRDMVRILNERGICLMHLERWEAAREALEASHRLCVAQENHYLKAICEVNLGSWERQQGHWAKAEAWYAPLPAFFEQVGDPLLQAEILFYLSQVTQAQGEFERARAYLNRVLGLAEEVQNRHFAALAHQGQARLAVEQGQPERALDFYWQATRQIEGIRSAQQGSGVRLDFQAQWREMYQEATAQALQLERPKDALRFSEHARARLLLDRLGVPSDAARPDAPPDLLLALERLEQSLHHLYVRQLAGELDAAGWNRLEAQEARMAEVRTRLERYDQTHLPYHAPPNLEHIQAALSPSALALSYFAAGERMGVFAISRDHIRHYPLPVTPSQVRSRLDEEGQIQGIGPDRHTGQLFSWPRILALLYQGLLEPLAAQLAHYETFYLAPETSLRHIPFHLLSKGPESPCPLTAEGRRVFYLPSASVLTRLPARRQESVRVAVGYNGPDLELVETHAKRVCEQMGGTVIAGPAATRDAVRAEIDGSSQLYFAGHNIFRSPAPADCGLLLAGERLLTLLDVQGLRLGGAQVVLGACQSSLSAEYGGDWLGLTGAFLQAGAAQVMGTLWPVSEVAMCLLMDRFWAAWRRVKGDIWVALEQAQSELRIMSLEDVRQGFSAYALSSRGRDYLASQLEALQAARPGAAHPLDHPYYWAPFVLSGARGG